MRDQASRRPDTAASLLEGGRTVPCDPNFWDVQALRRNHVLRIVSDSALEFRSPDTQQWTPVDVHLLLHAVGLAVIRLTLRPETPGLSDLSVPQLQRFGDSVFRENPFAWRLPYGDAVVEASCDVRRTMDAVMFPLHERLMGRTAYPDFATLSDPGARYEWLERKVARGEIISPYPVVFGTAYELVWATPSERAACHSSLSQLAYGIEPDDDNPALSRAAEVQHTHHWFVSENSSVLALDGTPELTSLSAFDPLPNAGDRVPHTTARCASLRPACHPTRHHRATVRRSPRAPPLATSRRGHDRRVCPP